MKTSTMILIMLVYSFLVTSFTHAFATQFQTDIPVYTNTTDPQALYQQTATYLDPSSTTSILNVPVLDAVALVIHTGNFYLDLVGNFIFALPSMASAGGEVLRYMGVPAYYVTLFKLFIFSGVAIFLMIQVAEKLIGILTRNPTVRPLN